MKYLAVIAIALAMVAMHSYAEQATGDTAANEGELLLVYALVTMKLQLQKPGLSRFLC